MFAQTSFPALNRVALMEFYLNLAMLAAARIDLLVKCFQLLPKSAR